MEFIDYYKILGISPEADSKEIKTAYRKLARKYHPDMNPDKGAEDKFKEVAEAYYVLKDDKRRAEFDEMKRYGAGKDGQFKPSPEHASAFNDSNQFSGDFSDFFNSMFGERFNEGQFGGGRQQTFKGSDAEVEMPVFLEETIVDTIKTIAFQLPRSAHGAATQTKKQLKVKIPQGVTDGERIRLKGQGNPGEGGAGDLYIHIRLVPHPLFDVQGHDLIMALPVAPWEAVLGAKIVVPTLEGTINLTIPAGSAAGSKMRIKGKGLKGRKSNDKFSVGDLYVVLKIVLPKTNSKATDDMWKELALASDFDARAGWGAKV